MIPNCHALPEENQVAEEDTAVRRRKRNGARDVLVHVALQRALPMAERARQSVRQLEDHNPAARARSEDLSERGASKCRSLSPFQLV